MDAGHPARSATSRVAPEAAERQRQARRRWWPPPPRSVTVRTFPRERRPRERRPRGRRRPAGATARRGPSRGPTARPATAAPSPRRCRSRRRQTPVHRRQRRPVPGRGRRRLRQRPPVGPQERHRPAGVHPHAEVLLVHRPVVPPAQQHEVRERRLPAVGPVPDVVRIAAPGRAAREAALPVARGQRAAQRGRDGPRPADRACSQLSGVRCGPGSGAGGLRPSRWLQPIPMDAVTEAATIPAAARTVARSVISPRRQSYTHPFRQPSPYRTG